MAVLVGHSAKAVTTQIVKDRQSKTGIARHETDRQR